MTDPVLPGGPDAMLAFQRLAWSSLVFSVTLRCPLNCAHCITSSGPSPLLPVLSLEQAQRWAGELRQLTDEGLRHVTFTGGEPTLAMGPLRVLAEAAAAAGLRTAVVSSGAFAVSAARTKRVLDQLSCITHWDLGYDSYHGEHLAFERFAAAVRELARRDCSYSVRICESPDKRATEWIIEQVRAAAGPQALIIRQPVRRLGRAALAGPASAPGPALPRTPCPSTGPLLREDGSAGPCCSGLSYTPGLRHPFPSAPRRDLLEVWRSWRGDQLLRLIRLVGFAPVVRWLADDGLLAPTTCFSADPCELCASLWDPDGKAARAVRARADRPAVRAQLDELERELYGAVWGEAAPVTEATPAPST